MAVGADGGFDLARHAARPARAHRDRRGAAVAAALPYRQLLGGATRATQLHHALEVGLDEAQARAWDLAAYARSRLGAIRRLQLFDRGQRKCAIVTAAIEGWTDPEIVAELAARRVNASASLREYGILDFDAKGVGSVVRLSPHYYNTREEIDQLSESMTELSAQIR